jgi:UDP-N-acetylmuramoyl-L-alanyl-D-glutamate--2,6-diaminopimelate ligase
MILSDLIEGTRVTKQTGSGEVNISGISIDSKIVEKGFLFVALKGERTDGHKYVESAVSNGASAVMVERAPESVYKGVTVIEVPDSRVALAGVSANFYAHPTKELSLVGITGTNGKTTITYLLESIWRQERFKSAVLGTIDYRYGGSRLESLMTTPESLELMRMFREMRNSGVEIAAMEVSSHALDKKRVIGCHFDAAIFTNLTQDHLDYHGTIENYLNTKKTLFTDVLKSSEKQRKFSIINMDDPYGEEIRKEAPGEVITYSIHDPSAHVFAESSEITERGIRARVNTPAGTLDINSKLYGTHNLSNLLAASATAVSLGSSLDHIEKGLSEIGAIPGRLESVDNTLGIKVLVDYAHTPDALENVLRAARALTAGNLILVFGCGGDRDRTKRPKMGLIGKELSDILLVTSDNPRTESPEKIIDDIEAGVLGDGDKQKLYFRVSDRKEAIGRAIGMARENDTVLIAGKGHEDYQIVGTKKFPFDDRIIAGDALRERMN